MTDRPCAFRSSHFLVAKMRCRDAVLDQKVDKVVVVLAGARIQSQRNFLVGLGLRKQLIMNFDRALFGTHG